MQSTPLKIGVDISSMHDLNRGRGVGYYAKNLIDSLKKYTDNQLIVIEKEPAKTDVDLIHYPFFDFFRYTLPFKKKFPTVVTIHDVTPLVFPQHYPPGVRGAVSSYLQRLSLLSVKAVITDSESSKKDITLHLGVPKEKIYPIPLSQSDIFQPIKDGKILVQAKDKYKLPDRFALHVGNVNWNKNILNIAEACKRADIDLVLLGKGFEQRSNLNHPELRSFAEFLGKYGKETKVHIKGYVPDEDLVAIYNLAKVVLLPSYYEGFGLPILEAQACGTPVATGNISSMPEVAGEGAVLVNPSDAEAIKSGIDKIIVDAKHRKALVEKGFENIKRFSWKKTALQTTHVYHQILSHGN